MSKIDPLIADLRHQIDAINRQLLELMQRRAVVVLAIADRKNRLGLQEFDPAREEDMLRQLTREAAAGGPLTEQDVRTLFLPLFRLGLDLQQRRRLDPKAEGEAAAPVEAQGGVGLSVGA